MNEVEIVVVGADKTGAAFASARANAKKAGADAGKEFGEHFHRGSDGRLRDASGRFAKAGADSGKSFIDGFGRDSRGGLTGMLAKLSASAVGAGADIGSKLAGGMVSTLESTGPGGAAIGGAIVAAGVAAAPLLGGVLAAGVIGAAGAGGIIGGIMLVKDDPRVQQAASSMGSTITDSLKIRAEPMVDPLVRGMSIVKAAVVDSGDDFERVFTNAARWVEPLADSASSFIDDFTDGLANLTDAGDPVMAALGDGIERIGDMVETVFDTFSKVGPDAALALATAVDVVASAVEGVSRTIAGFAKVFGLLAKHGVFGDDMKKQWEEYNEAAKAGKAASEEAADGIGKIGDEAEDSRNQLERLADELRAQTDPIFALLDAQNSQAEAQQKYNDAVREHGKSSQEAKAALRDLAEAAIEVQSATGAAADTFDGRLPDSLRQTLIAAGWSADRIADLERQMQDAHAAGNRFARTYKATVVVNGVEWNIQKLRQLDASIRKLPAYKQVQIVTEHLDVYNKVGGFDTRSANAAEHGSRASGGPVYATAATGGARGAMTLVGEQGPELVRLPYGSTVQTAGASRAQLAAAAAELLDLNNDAGFVKANMGQKGMTADTARLRGQLASMYGKDHSSFAYQQRKGKFKGDWVDFHSMQAWLKNMSEWEEGRGSVQGMSAGSGPNRGSGNVNGRGTAIEVVGNTDSLFAQFFQRLVASGQIVIPSRNVA